jgi:lysine 6-dehydrogenase
MRAAIFGSGLMGSAIARDLVQSRDVEQVAVFDVDKTRLRRLRRLEPSSKLSVRIHDVRRHAQTVGLLKNFDVGVGALPYELCEHPIRATLEARTDFVDLIFGWRYECGAVNTAAQRRGITIIPACGLAPGLSNILAMTGADRLDKTEEVHMKIGGIPEKPRPPLNYRIVFSFEAVLEEYLRKARIVTKGRVVEVDALSGLETVSFPPPIGKCECFYTDGLSTLVGTLRGTREMDEKTIRWPGHVAQIRTLIECGLLDNKPVHFEGTSVTPRKFVAQLLSDRLSLGNERDLTLFRVDVVGKRRGERARIRYDMIDHYDDKRRMTSMARTTAFPCSAAALLLGRNQVPLKGLIPPELAFDEEDRVWLFSYLASRGIDIKSKS